MTDFKQWEGFEGRIWKEEVNTRDFIQKNYTPYDGDESFLAGPTDATNKLWGALQKLQKAERAKGGVLDMETEVVSGLTAYGPGYIDEELKDAVRITVIATGFKVGASQSSMDFAPRKDLFASTEPAPQPVQQAPVTFSAPAPTSRFTDEDYIPDFLKRAR